MHFDEVVVTRSHLNTQYQKDNLLIYGIKVSVHSSYKVIKLIADDLKRSKNNRISIIVQNYQIIILISTMEKRKSINSSTQDKIAINPQIAKIQGVKLMTGYGIYSLLHEDFIKIQRNAIMTFNKFNQKTLWRPYKISSLEVDSNTFSLMLDLLSTHRFILSFNPWHDFSNIQITLIIMGSSNEQLIINTEEVRNNLKNIKTLHGELETYQKKELRTSMLQILLGVSKVNINSSSMIGYFKKLNFSKQNQVFFPKYSAQYQDHLNYRNNKKLVKPVLTHKTLNPIINKSIGHLISVPQQLEREGWIENNEIDNNFFTVYTHSNLQIYVVILKNIDFEDSLNTLLSHGLFVVFRSNGKELVYIKSIVNL